MRISLVSFTEAGEKLAFLIKEKSALEIVEIENRHEKENRESLSEWTRRQFEMRNGIVFIGAAGIAVRAIAPFVKDKLSDSPVLVADEKGRFVIPLLSGHMGGANELAGELAATLDAIPVITTATDVNGKFAVDVFAKENGLGIVNRDGIEKVSAKILKGKKITLAVDEADIVISRKRERIEGALLQLRPKEYVLGIGCRKGKEFTEIQKFIRKNLDRLDITEEDVCILSSIDLKAGEEGILRWKNYYRVPFVTFTKEELERVPGKFTESAFVEEKTGVGNVCERAAMAACRGKGEVVLEKQAENGMTLAIVRKTEILI